MALIRRLTDSCLLVTTDAGTTLVDPGFFTWESGEVDLDSIGEVQRVLITHEHRDHVHPGFVRWLVDRGTDVTVHANPTVAALLGEHGIEAATGDPGGVTSEDVNHEVLPTGAAPPNRSYTVEGVVTHPGDSYQPSHTAPVLALPLMAPWGSITAAVAFARRLRPRQVIPVHDFYLTAAGREFAARLATGALEDIEVVALGWGESYTV